MLGIQVNTDLLTMSAYLLSGLLHNHDLHLLGKQNPECLYQHLILRMPLDVQGDRQPAVKPDNVYGNGPPVDILADNENDPFTAPPSDQRPGPSGNPSGRGVRRAPSADLTKMVQNGGAKLIDFLLRAAVSSADAKKSLMFLKSMNGTLET